MPRDRSLQLRQAVIVHLRADSDLTGLVPSERLYGRVSPAPPELLWPFTRFGAADAVPQRGTCWDGSRIAFTIHSFTRHSPDAPASSKFEDECATINSAIIAALGDAVLAIAGGGKATISWLGSEILTDGDQVGAWHGLNRFEAVLT